MTDKELRELDAWISTTLFGWLQTDVNCDPTDNRTIGGFLYSPNGFNGDCNQASYVPHYTTDPAAAMEVLRKCGVQTERLRCMYVGKVDDKWLIGLHDLKI